jgi:sterol 3beta-glucosyltransferase
MGGADGQGMVASGASLIRLARGIGRTVGPILRRMGDDFWQACQGADAIISGLNGVPFFGYEFARRLGAAYCSASILPLRRTRAWANPMWPLSWQLGRGYNLLTHKIVEQLGWQMFRRTINRWQQETLDLPALPLAGAFADLQRLPMLFGVSPLVLPKPVDWGDACELTGYWFLPAPNDWRPPNDLRAFMESGPPPICISFGSMSDRNAEQITQIVLAALQKTGQRGILVTGWGGLHQIDLTPDVFAIDSVPFDWLWPQCAAVVHHGGAGSTGAGLRAGIPSIVVPFFADQPFWGRRVHTLGVGPRLIPRRKLSLENLAAAITQALTDQKMRTRAAELGQLIRSEDGIARAVEAFGRIIQSDMKTVVRVKDTNV